MTTEELLKDFNAKVETLKAGQVSKEDIDALKTGFETQLKEVKDGALTAEAVKTIFESEAEKLIADLQSKGSNTGETEFVKKAKETAANFKENDRNFQQTTTVKAAALMTTANVAGANGFSTILGNYIDAEIGNAPRPQNIMLDLVTRISAPGVDAAWYSDRINEEGDAAFIAEGALKPLADAEYVTTKALIKEVAVRWKFTKRLMNHAPSAIADFNEYASILVDDKIDGGILSGDGTGNNINGLFSTNVASAFIVPSGLANYYERANIFDAIMALATQVRLANFTGNLTVVLNYVWKAKMAGIKNADGDYIIAPFVSPDGTRVGEVAVRFSNRVAAGKIVGGDLSKLRVVFAEDVTFDEGYENDDFSKNLVSRKLEAFLGTYIKRSDAGAIVADDIATILTAIEVAP